MMNTTYQIIITTPNEEQRKGILALLREENLPIEDLTKSMVNFFVAVEGSEVIGAIGLEQYNNCGLLRSMVVSKLFRNRNIASALVKQLESQAEAQGIECIYLLTETAKDYFEKKGYQKTERDNVPAVIKASSEFSHVCPSTAVVMKKSFSGKK